MRHVAPRDDVKNTNERQGDWSEGTEEERPVSDLYAALTDLMPWSSERLSIHRAFGDRIPGSTAPNAPWFSRLGPGRHVPPDAAPAIFLAEAHGVRVVLNHESLCYAADKPAYLRDQGVYRVLKPGGRWRSLDADLANRNEPLPERLDALLAALEWNWRLPPYRAWRDVLSMAEEAGFTGIKAQDLTSEALPSTDRLRRRYSLFSFLNPQIRDMNPAFQEAMDGSVCFAQGLSEGLFKYRLISATRPM